MGTCHWHQVKHDIIRMGSSRVVSRLMFDIRAMTIQQATNEITAALKYSSLFDNGGDSRLDSIKAYWFQLITNQLYQGIKP